MRDIFFFLGKGGVGKSTLSASLSLYLSDRGFKVFWASIDPAHNLCDILKIKSFKGTKEVLKNLWAEEIDLDHYLKTYLKDIKDKTYQTYSYLNIFNLDKMFDIIKLTPGMEEFACLYALKDIFNNHKNKDFIVIDTPPTALTLKILGLPFVTKKWLEQLKSWREKILDRRNMVAHIKGKNHFNNSVALDKDDDKVLRELQSQQKQTDFFMDVFLNKDTTHYILVVNPDELSMLEGKRIIEHMKNLNMDIRLILVNKGLKSNKLNDSHMFNYKLSCQYVPFKQGEIGQKELIDMASQWTKDVFKF